MFLEFVRDEAQAGSTFLLTHGSRFQKQRNSPSKGKIAMDNSVKIAWDVSGVGTSEISTRSNHRTVVFVAIDFENLNKITDTIKSGDMARKPPVFVGLSIFNTRDFSSPLTSNAKSFKTYNIGVGGCPSYRKMHSQRFLFGETIWLSSLADMAPKIESLLDRSLNIIFVGHGFTVDKIVLQQLGIDMETSVVGIIDTEHLATRAMKERPYRGDLRLRNVLARLGCNVENCHTAGNDANYTLRALFLLVAERTSNLASKMTDAQVERVNRLRELALSSISRYGSRVPTSPTSSSEANID